MFQETALCTHLVLTYILREKAFVCASNVRKIFKNSVTVAVNVRGMPSIMPDNDGDSEGDSVPDDGNAVPKGEGDGDGVPGVRNGIPKGKGHLQLLHLR